MRQLIALAERHAGAMADRSGRHGTWFSHQAPHLEMSLRTITDTPITHALALELADVLDRTKEVPLLDDGVVHNDFHHRNFLAIGDDVTGYFDWEFADIGDWRYDLVTLAWWTTVMQMDAARLAVDRMQRCASRTSWRSSRPSARSAQLDFDVRNNPAFLPGLIERIRADIAPWWRGRAKEGRPTGVLESQQLHPE